MLPKERRALTHDEARALESALAGAPDEAMWLAMLLLGLRPGEATGLTWADVDLDEGVLHMAGDRKWTPKGYVLGRPKTRRGNRALEMPPCLAEAFARLTPGGPDDFVFPTRTGSLRDPSNDRHRLARPSRPTSYATRRRRCSSTRASPSRSLPTCSATPPRRCWSPSTGTGYARWWTRGCGESGRCSLPEHLGVAWVSQTEGSPCSDSLTGVSGRLWPRVTTLTDQHRGVARGVAHRAGPRPELGEQNRERPVSIREVGDPNRREGPPADQACYSTAADSLGPQ